jgi:hypothetical protein
MFALRNQQSNVVVLLARTELLHVVKNGIQQRLWPQVTMPPQTVNEPLFSEFFAMIVERFGDTIRVQYKRVSRQDAAFPYPAIPLLEKPQNGARGTEPIQSVIAVQEKARQMPTIRIS